MTLLTKSLLYSFVLLGGIATANAQLKVSNRFSIPGNGRYDYLTTAPNNELYVSHGNKVDIIKTTNGSYVDSITGMTNVHGVALDYKTRKGFISDGGNNRLVVFNMDTHKKVGEILGDKNPDAIVFEPLTKTIIVGNGKSNNISVIDPATDKIIHTVNIGGKPEAIVSDGKENLFVNMEDKNAIAVISLKDFTLTGTIDISKEGEGPAGLAIDTKDQLLFAGCDKKLVVVHYPDKKIVGSYPIGDHSDGVAYNQFTQTVFTSNGDGTLNVLHRKLDGTGTTKSSQHKKMQRLWLWTKNPIPCIFP